MRIAILLTAGAIILLVVGIFAGHIGLFSPMWWAWILMQVFTSGAAGFNTALALVQRGYFNGALGGHRGSDTSTAD